MPHHHNLHLGPCCTVWMQLFEVSPLWVTQNTAIVESKGVVAASVMGHGFKSSLDDCFGFGSFFQHNLLYRFTSIEGREEDRPCILP